jgi:hypothetical protein
MAVLQLKCLRTTALYDDNILGTLIDLRRSTNKKKSIFSIDVTGEIRFQSFSDKVWYTEQHTAVC